MKTDSTLGTTARCIVALAALALPALGVAHEGHDDEPAAAASTAATMPAPGDARFAAVSDQFELVGVLDGRTVTLYLDRFADNTPVIGARLEVELGADAHLAQVAGDAYVVRLPAPPAAGTIPVTATVTAGEATDLLAADLVVPGGAPAAHAAPAAGPGLAAPSAGALWPGVAAAALFALLGWAFMRRRGRNPSS